MKIGTSSVMLFAVFVILSGCTTRGRIIAHTLAGGIVAQAEVTSDRAMDALDKALLVSGKVDQHTRHARCRMPHTALVRYARRGEKEAATVALDCGMVVQAIESVTTFEVTKDAPEAHDSD